MNCGNLAHKPDQIGISLLGVVNEMCVYIVEEILSNRFCPI